MEARELFMLTDRNQKLFDARKYHEIRRESHSGFENSFVMKAYIYAGSLRFHVMSERDLTREQVDYSHLFLCNTMCQQCVSKAYLWYGQTEGFSTELIDRFQERGLPYRFFEYAISPADMQKTKHIIHPLIAKPYQKKMLADCIALLESAYTPELDQPGTFEEDKKRISGLFRNSDTMVFFLENILIGLYCCNQGELEYLAIKKTAQGSGHGKRIVSRMMDDMLKKSIPEIHLCTKTSNETAIHLYEKMGFYRLCENSRTEIYVNEVKS